MADPHVIRLRGPWEYEALGDPSTELPPPGRVQFPADENSPPGPDYRGRVRYRRYFNWLAELEPSERVWLLIAGIEALAELVLNARPLGQIGKADEPARFDVTGRIAQRNELSIEVEFPFRGEVWLEVHGSKTNEDVA